MADKDKFLATFRIDQDEWKDFMAQAKAEGKSASAVLVDFICWYRTGNRIAADTTPYTNLGNLTVLIDERIEARLQSLEQPHSDNLDAILDERDRRVESRLLSILETMLETKLDDKLEELQGNITSIEYALDNRLEKLEQAQQPVQEPVGMEARCYCGKVEIEMQQENDQLKAQVEQLLRENEALKQQNQQLQQELSNRGATPVTPLPDYEAVRDRILKSLITGKGKVATTSPQYKTAARALDRFILELRESAPVSTPASSTPDGTAAPMVEEATKKLEDKHYTKDEYYADLRQIVERCGYRLFIDNTTLGRGRELFIVNPPGNAPLRVLSTQDIGEVVDWLRKQDLFEQTPGTP